MHRDHILIDQNSFNLLIPELKLILISDSIFWTTDYLWIKNYISLLQRREVSVVVYWPPTRPNMPFQRRRELHIPLASYGKRLQRRAWLTIWDTVKIPRCSHKLMHRKRVTCELHDSYFRSIMIKHAIPKTAEVAYSFGQLWEEIEWT